MDSVCRVSVSKLPAVMVFATVQRRMLIVVVPVHPARIIEHAVETLTAKAACVLPKSVRRPPARMVCVTAMKLMSTVVVPVRSVTPAVGVNEPWIV